MKRETFTHPKTYDLAARLQVNVPQALGHLALMWDFTATYAIAGNIGKHSDSAIAKAAGWDCSIERPVEAFIEALIEAGWLDRSKTHRLIVHDWSDHCERWVKLKALKLGITLIPTIEPSIEPSIEAITEPSTEPSTEASVYVTNPIQSKPIQSADGAATPAIRHADDMEEFDTREWLITRDATEDEIAWVFKERKRRKLMDKPPAYLLSMIATRRTQKLGKPPPVSDAEKYDLPEAGEQPGYAAFQRRMRASSA